MMSSEVLVRGRLLTAIDAGGVRESTLNGAPGMTTGLGDALLASEVAKWSAGDWSSKKW